MVHKIKVCPKCKKWTIEGTKCDICESVLIYTEYTDMFFNKISPEKQCEYVQKAIGEQNSAVIKSTDVNTRQQVNSSVGKALQIIGGVIIFLGLVVAFILGKDAYGDISFGLFILYFLGGLVTGLFTIGFGEIINLLYSINKKLEN